MRYVLILLVFISCQGLADTYSHEGYVERVGAIPERENGDFIVVGGFLEAGTCPISQGLVSAKVPDSESGSRSFAIALAAKMANKKIKLTVDDTNKNPRGYCYLYALEIKE